MASQHTFLLYKYDDVILKVQQKTTTGSAVGPAHTPSLH